MIKDNLFGFGNIDFHFNDNNVSMNIQEANFYGNDGTVFNLNATLSICNDKFKEMKKEDPKLLNIFNKFNFFLKINGINLNKLKSPNYKINRASKGIKTINVSFTIDDTIYSYGLGANLSNFRGYSKINIKELNIQNRIRKCEEIMCDLISFNDEKSILARQIASVEQKEFRDIWKEKFSSEWIEKLDNAKKEGISYHKLKNKFNINQFRIAS